VANEFVGTGAPRATSVAPPDPLLTAEECAAYLKIPLQTIYDWRYRGIGPRAYKIGRYLRFRLSDVDAWIDAQA
jgi:excisionase family DNA binding protein